MNNSEFKNSTAYRCGSNGERSVSKVLQANGGYVHANYNFSGKDDDKAPQLYGEKKSLVLPDLMCFENYIPRWVEVKVRERASFTNSTQKWEFGINVRHYRDYMEVQEASGTPVFFFVYEIYSKKLYAGRLEEMKIRQTQGKETDRSDKFISVDQFETIPYKPEVAQFPEIIYTKDQWEEEIRNHSGIEWRGDYPIFSKPYQSPFYKRGQTFFCTRIDATLENGTILGEWVEFPKGSESRNDPLPLSKGYIYHNLRTT